MNKNKDFLILSYNEGQKDFEENDCKEIIDKINVEKPAFIFVCTQESNKNSKRNYQHIFGEFIKKYDYKRLLKLDAFNPTIPIYNRNIRTRIYYNTKNVYNKIDIMKNKFLITGQEDEDKSYLFEDIFNNNNYINKKYLISEVGYTISKKSGLGEYIEFTQFKGSISTRLVIKRFDNTSDKKDINFIVVNSHLYFQSPNSKGNTGLKKRETEFYNVINEFKLNEYYNKDYNIFFCGDLNFRLGIKNKDTNIISNNIISEDIIKKFGLNNKESKNKESKNKESKYINELYNSIQK